MNRLTPSVSVLTVLLLLAGGAAGALHAGPAGNKPWKQPAWKVAKVQYDVIRAVNVSAGTLEIHHMGGTVKVDRALSTNAFSEIFVDGKKATLADLKPGTRVEYTLGGDGATLARLQTVAAPAPPPTPVPTATPSFPKAGKRK